MNASTRSILMREVFIIASPWVALCFISYQLELFEALAEWVRKYENSRFTDFLLAVLLLIITLTVFAFRWGKLSRAELEKRKTPQGSDLKQENDALRNSKLRHKELADALSQYIYEYDLDGQLTFANQAFYSRSGYDESDFRKGFKLLDLIAPGDRERAKENMRRRLTGEDIGAQEYKGITKDGTTYPLLIYGNAALQGGKVVGGIGIA